MPLQQPILQQWTVFSQKLRSNAIFHYLVCWDIRIWIGLCKREEGREAEREAERQRVVDIKVERGVGVDMKIFYRVWGEAATRMQPLTRVYRTLA